MQVIFTDNSVAIHDGSELQNLEINRFLLPNPHLERVSTPQIAMLDQTTFETTDDQTSVEANGDQAGRSALFGRYMGQITARVERAWARPRSIPEEGAFACRVQVTQDRHGTVLEVTLDKCTDDAQWQLSLVRAIDTASPLPAPPDTSVFSNLLTLEFNSDAYTAGAGEQGFEPAQRHQNTSEVQAFQAFPSSSSLAPRTGPPPRPARSDGSWDLTIIGSRQPVN